MVVVEGDTTYMNLGLTFFDYDDNGGDGEGGGGGGGPECYHSYLRYFSTLCSLPRCS